MSSSLNDSVHLSRWLTLFSRHTSTFELRNRSWIEITIESFRMFSASVIWRSVRNLLISVMTFSIVIARWVIDEVEGLMICMRRYVSKISKMNINSSRSIVSLIAFTIIWSITSLLIVSLIDSVVRLSLIIWYARLSSAWYLFTTSIDQWASTNTALVIIVIEVTNWRNSLLAKFLSASVSMWSERLRYTSIQHKRSIFQVCLAEMFYSHLATWNRVASSTTCRMRWFSIYMTSTIIE
jgi:hypothetical protein